jgi:hypothetical protein
MVDPRQEGLFSFYVQYPSFLKEFVHYSEIF